MRRSGQARRQLRDRGDGLATLRTEARSLRNPGIASGAAVVAHDNSRSGVRRGDFLGARRQVRRLRKSPPTEAHSGQDERGDEPDRRQHADDAAGEPGDEPDAAAAAEDLVAYERTAAGRAVFRKGRRASLSHARSLAAAPGAVMAVRVGFFWIICRGPERSVFDLARRCVPDGVGLARGAPASGRPSLVGDRREGGQGSRASLAHQIELGFDELRLEDVDAPARFLGLRESLGREGRAPGTGSQRPPPRGPLPEEREAARRSDQIPGPGRRPFEPPAPPGPSGQGRARPSPARHAHPLLPGAGVAPVRRRGRSQPGPWLARSDPGRCAIGPESGPSGRLRGESLPSREARAPRWHRGRRPRDRPARKSSNARSSSRPAVFHGSDISRERASAASRWVRASASFPRDLEGVGEGVVRVEDVVPVAGLLRDRERIALEAQRLVDVAVVGQDFPEVGFGPGHAVRILEIPSDRQE